jgi:hypothetical protein
LWEEAKDCAVRLISKFVQGEDVGTGWDGDLGPLAGVERRFKARECVPFSGWPSGAGLSRTDRATDAHSYKSESEERVGEGTVGLLTSVGRRTRRTACKSLIGASILLSDLSALLTSSIRIAEVTKASPRTSQTAFRRQYTSQDAQAWDPL